MENKDLFPQIGGMLPGDYVPPEYRLIQRTTSGVKGQPGQFWHSLKQEAKGEIHALVLKLTEVRTKWGRDEISSDPPECASDDASSFKSRDGQDCLECPDRCDNPWDYSQEERRTKCLKGFVILGIDLDEGEPFLLRVAGVSTQPIKEFATNLRFRALKGDKTPPRVCFRGMEKATQYGTAYYVQPSIEGTMGEEEMSAISPFASELISLPAAPLPELPRSAEKHAPTQEASSQHTTGSLIAPETKEDSESSPDIDF